MPSMVFDRKSTMHPVQAAPRQRPLLITSCDSMLDAPRAGSAEAKSVQRMPLEQRLDAPRAGSAEAKQLVRW